MPVVLTASAVPRSGGGYILTVTGSNFLPGAQIVVDGTVMTATVRIGSGELQVVLPAEPSGTVLTVSAENVVAGAATEADQKIPVTIGGGKLVILQTQPWPSPYTGNGPGWVSVDLEGPADNLALKVYTKAMVLVGTSDAGPQPAGWVSVPLPTTIAGAADGLYYFTVSAERGGQWIHPVVGRMYILR